MPNTKFDLADLREDATLMESLLIQADNYEEEMSVLRELAEEEDCDAEGVETCFTCPHNEDCPRAGIFGGM